MPRADWTVDAEQAITTQGLAVRFAHTRTEYLSARLEVGQEDPLQIRMRGSSGSGSWPSRAVGGEAPARLVVVFRGEVPLLVRARWTTTAPPGSAAGVVLVPTPPKAAPDRADIPLRGVSASIAQPANGELLAVAEPPPLTWAEKVEESQRAFDAREDAIHAHAASLRFFARLDRDTDPYLAPLVHGTCVVPLQRKLWDRLCIRASTGFGGHVPDLRPLEDLRKPLELVSKIFADAADDCIGNDPGRATLYWAFALFACGRLATHHRDPATHAKLQTHGVPNSLNYFMFGELALACLELDPPVMPDLWVPLLPTLVTTCAIFMIKPIPGWDHQRIAAPAQASIVDPYIVTMRCMHSARKRLEDCVPKALAARFGFLEDVFTYYAGRTIRSKITVTGPFRRDVNVPPLLTQESLAALAQSPPDPDPE